MGKRSSYIVEATYPYAIGIAAALAVAPLDISIPTDLLKKGYSLPGVFSNILNFNLFAAGIMFSMFVFTMAPAAGFIAKLERLNLYRVFRRYTLEAVALGLLGALASIPLSVSTPKAMEEGLMPLLTVIAVGLSLAFVFSIYRVVRIFLFWTSIR